MEDYVRHRRKNGNIYSWPSKLYIPVPLGTKNEFAKVARINRMSQAELGAVIVMHYLVHLEWLTKAIEQYKATQEELRAESLEQLQNEAETGATDRTFGGVFKSSFPENEE